MAVGPRLEFRQTQSLVMTPQLRQAIKLLQFTNLEVVAFVEQELERNPLLERDERSELVSNEAAAPDQLPERNRIEPDTADLTGAVQVLRDLGVEEVWLVGGDAGRRRALEEYGLTILR